MKLLADEEAKDKKLPEAQIAACQQHDRSAAFDLRGRGAARLRSPPRQAELCSGHAPVLCDSLTLLRRQQAP